ncbi:hypothetical protein J2Y69_001778 [Microbacterium resistens]|uniref:DUF4184 family protein n=1 Tax=Microbacterium resistens TaxID=156977 RepID=A0ABU1SC47_9MICO|nr:DUF4184 family protein [Microbacterium resistens]MDR6867179.1 hypothetical protein [Microbacterium resistens]
MPFTPSHAIVAVPFVRTPLVPAAIAIGAMTPDLPLFVRLNGPAYVFAHDLRMLPATMLVALGLLLVWRLLLRPASRALAPTWLARRLPESWDARGRTVLSETFPSARGVLWLLAALALGVASHIAWDEFTHEGRTGTSFLPVLDEQWGPLPGYKWLQHGSSALGLLLLAVAALVWLRHRRPGAIPRQAPGWLRMVWWLSLPLALVVGWLVGLAVYGAPDAEFTAQHLAYRVLPPACAVWAVLTLALCLGVGRIVARSTPIPKVG